MSVAGTSSSVAPTTRSRTLLFISYRDSTARSSRVSRFRTATNYGDTYHAADEHEGLIGATDHDRAGHVSLDIELPPKWVDISDQVEEILASTQVKITALEKLHAKHVLPGFTDRSAEEREIEAVTSNVTRDFRKCQSLIQEISATPSHAFPPSQGGPSQHQILTAKNVQRGLAAKVQELSATFRKKQRIYMEKLQGHAIKNQDLLVASGAISLKGSEGMTAVDEDVEASRRSQSTTQELLAPDLQARDHEISEIAKSIASLAELFKDLATLVIDQGTLLDSVEYNIEQTAVQVAEAVTELNVATKYQKNTGRRKCIFLLLLIIFGLVLVLIFKPRRYATPPALSPTESALPHLVLAASTPVGSDIALHRWALRHSRGLKVGCI